MELSDFLIILISLIVTGMLPWGYMIHGRLTAIEVAVKETTQFRSQIANLGNDLHDLELRFAKVEGG